MELKEILKLSREEMISKIQELEEKKTMVDAEQKKEFDKEIRLYHRGLSYGTHISHCCIKHGCKYGEDDECPVVNGIEIQKYICMDCDNEGIKKVEDIIPSMVESRLQSALETLTTDEILAIRSAIRQLRQPTVNIDRVDITGSPIHEMVEVDLTKVLQKIEEGLDNARKLY